MNLGRFPSIVGPGSIRLIMIVMLFVQASILITPVLGQVQSSDLFITSSDITFSNDNPASGEIITITIEVHNGGPSVATNINVDFFVSGVPLPPSKSITTIQVDSSGTADHYWTTPLPGIYTIKVEVNGDQGDPEASNNQAEKNITVGTIVPTIIVDAAPNIDVLQAGQDFWVNGSANMNSEPVDGGDVDVEIMATGVSGTNTTDPDGNFAISMVAPMDQDVFEIRVTVTQGAVNGQDEFNITVLQADLKITTFTFNANANPDGLKIKADDHVKVKVGFQNIGNGTAKGVAFELMVDGKIVRSVDDIGDLNAGQTDTVTYMWTAKKGSHNFQATLDPDDTIDEISEDNNNEAKSLDVKKGEKPSPSFEIAIFIFAIIAIFLLMKNGNGRHRR